MRWVNFAFRVEEWGRLQTQEDDSWDKLTSRLGRLGNLRVASCHHLDHTSDHYEDELMGQAPPKGKSAAPKPESSEDGGQPGGKNHYAEIVRPEMLGQWAIEKNPALRYLHEAMQDWGERRGNPSRRPVCLTCPHEFRADGGLPPAWMFVRLSVNKAGVPKQMILVGICEKCAAKDDAALLREGCADLRRAFPDMPEFEMRVVQEGVGRG
jgi:hypothetical protein